MGNAESNIFGNYGGAVKSNNIMGDVNQTTIHQHGRATQLPLTSPIRFKIRNSDPNFTGRIEEMNFLDQRFGVAPYIVVVCGMGGVGKTSLVRKYVDSEKFESYNVIWINAKESESIKKDFESVASCTAVDTDSVGKDFKSICDAVLSKLCKFPTLIVLDNVDDGDVQTFVLENVLNLWPSGYHRPHFIVTSRIQKWSSNSVYSMTLRRLNDTDAIELVTKLLTNNEPNDEEESPCNDSPENIKELIEILESFPLTIRQATAHINSQREVMPFSINDYINEYNSCRQEFLDSKHFQDETFFEYRETTFTTWIVTIEAIARSGFAGILAVRILRIIAYFEADHICRDIFFHLKHTDNKISEGDIISAVQLLVKYSMIEGRKRQSVLTIHRLVQSVMKIYLENDIDLSRSALRDGLNIIHKRLKQKNLKDAAHTFEHGMSVFLSVLAKEDLAKDLSFFALTVLEKAFDCGKFQQCMYFGDLVLPNAITFESAVGIAFPNIGKHAEAFEMFRDVFAKRLQMFGADHADTFTIRTSIAALHSDKGKYAEVLLMLQEVYEKRVQSLGADHPGAITIKSWIADVLHNMEKCDEAVQMFRDVYVKREQIFGADHPEAITVQSQTANSFLKMGKYVDALQMHQDVYEKQVHTLGDNHPDTINTESWIAHSLYKMGKYPEALRMFQNVYEKRERLCGADNPDTIKISFWIAVSFLQMGKYVEASQKFQELYARRLYIFVSPHPHSETITMESSVEVSYLTMGKYAETLDIFEEIYGRLVQIFGSDHQHVVTINSWITIPFHDLEKYVEALQKFQDVNKKVVQIFYDENKRNAVAMCISSWLNYLEVEKHTEAELLQIDRIICDNQFAGIFARTDTYDQIPIRTAISMQPNHDIKHLNLHQEMNCSDKTKISTYGAVKTITQRTGDEVCNDSSKTFIFSSIGEHRLQSTPYCCTYGATIYSPKPILKRGHLARSANVFFSLRRGDPKIRVIDTGDLNYIISCEEFQRFFFHCEEGIRK